MSPERQTDEQNKKSIQKYWFAFDTNVFRLITTDSLNYSKFISEMEKIGLRPKFSQKGFILSPFTLLEYIGVAIPDPDIRIPKELTEIEDIIKFITQRGTDFYNHHPNLSQKYLTEKSNKQRKFVVPEATALYEICVDRILKKKDFKSIIVDYLLTDFIYKYKYPASLYATVYNLFSVGILQEETPGYQFSKFRVIVDFWQRNYEKLKKHSKAPKHALEKTNKAMSLKTKKDFVDTELVHMTTMGFIHQRSHYPVIGLTTDNIDNLIHRIAVYKGFIQVNKDKYLKSGIKIRKSIENHNGGHLIFFDKKINITKQISVENIPAII